jgi:hypothetical protein
MIDDEWEARRVIAEALQAQGAAYPRCGADLIYAALTDAGFTVSTTAVGQ